MAKNKDVATEQDSKELTVDDLEEVAGGFEAEIGVEIRETAGGNKGVKIE